MPEDKQDKQKHYRIQIRRLTKRIGQALNAHDHNEADNLRSQRQVFIKALIEEFHQFFILKDGKSHFVDYDAAEEHYQNPDNRKAVAIARAVSEMCQGREYCRKRVRKLENLSDAEVKMLVLEEMDEQMGRMEKIINELLADIGKPPMNFGEADENKDKNVDFLDGIDLSSLL